MNMFYKIKMILESYEINFDYDRDEDSEDSINGMVPHLVDPSETRVFSSENMRNNGLRVIRFNNKDGQVEYHLHSTNISPYTERTPKEQQDPTSVRHSLSIIGNDAKEQLDAGREVKIQCLPHRHKIYSRIIRSMNKDDDYEVENTEAPVWGYSGNVPTFILRKK